MDDRSCHRRNDNCDTDFICDLVGVFPDRKRMAPLAFYGITATGWHDFNTDDEYDEDQFMVAHDEVMRLTITEIAKRLTNINGVSTLLTNMK